MKVLQRRNSIKIKQHGGDVGKWAEEVACMGRLMLRDVHQTKIKENHPPWFIGLDLENENYLKEAGLWPEEPPAPEEPAAAEEAGKLCEEAAVGGASVAEAAVTEEAKGSVSPSPVKTLYAGSGSDTDKGNGKRRIPSKQRDGRKHKVKGKHKQIR
jgi:hypothetical protein